MLANRCSAGCAASPCPRARMPRMATQWVNVEAIGSYFESLSDPRHTRNRKHRLVDIVVIAVCGMVCGCDGPTAIHRWASEPPRVARAVPGASQRHPLARLHPSPDHGPEARRPSRSVFRSGSPTRSSPTKASRTGSSPSTARPIGGPTIAPPTSVPSISSPPGPARKGSLWDRSPPRRNPTRSPRFPCSWSRST